MSIPKPTPSSAKAGQRHVGRTQAQERRTKPPAIDDYVSSESAITLTGAGGTSQDIVFDVRFINKPFLELSPELPIGDANPTIVSPLTWNIVSWNIVDNYYVGARLRLVTTVNRTLIINWSARGKVPI